MKPRWIMKLNFSFDAGNGSSWYISDYLCDFDKIKCPTSTSKETTYINKLLDSNLHMPKDIYNFLNESVFWIKEICFLTTEREVKYFCILMKYYFPLPNCKGGSEGQIVLYLAKISYIGWRVRSFYYTN